jgi:hypothetical protein
LADTKGDNQDYREQQYPYYGCDLVLIPRRRFQTEESTKRVQGIHEPRSRESPVQDQEPSDTAATRLGRVMRDDPMGLAVCGIIPRYGDHSSSRSLAFNKTVVIRHRICPEQAQYASSTINLRLAAVRRRLYEASDAGVLSPDLAGGIRRVKGAKRRGVRLETGSPPNRAGSSFRFVQRRRLGLPFTAFHPRQFTRERTAEFCGRWATRADVSSQRGIW